MAARDAFNLSTKRWEELENRFLENLKQIAGAEDEGSALLAAVIFGMKPREREALALGVMVGRVSMCGIAGGLVGAADLVKKPSQKVLTARGSS